VVLDLGSGGGIDVLLSAKRVGPTGKAYGLDMTDEMLALARENQRKAGVTNVEFLKGEIENIPLPDASVDVIISNCVINLSADKRQVLREAFRVLKPGGRFAVSDVVVRGEIPDAVRRSMELWVGCVAGALEEGEYRRLLAEAGFEDVGVEPTRIYEFEGGLDAEVLAFDGDRAVPFTTFQTRLGRKDVSGEVRERLPASLVVFDLLERDGRALLDLPLTERHELLRALPLTGPVRRARHAIVDATGDELVAILDREFLAARERGNEGLMVKDPRSPYRPGRRGMEWLKVKRALRTLDVVVTAVEWGHGKRHGVLSDYTFSVRDGERLRVVGKAYSGLTDKEIAEMTEHFLASTVQDLGRARIVRPDTVIEVAFDQIQESDRHDSGYAMRFPRIVRLRPDKPVSEIDTLDTVRAIAEGKREAPS